MSAAEQEVAVQTEPAVEAIAPAAAVPAEARIDALDYARGFALLGIVLMNVEWFERPIQGLLAGIGGGYTGWHASVDLLIEWLIQGKFYPLFSLLFGMGFAVMLQRGEARSGSAGFVLIYTRRLLALLAFGVIHGVLFYPGDILHAYALAGMALLLGFGLVLAYEKVFGRRPHRRWLAILPIAYLAALPMLFGSIEAVRGWRESQVSPAAVAVPAEAPSQPERQSAAAAPTVPSVDAARSETVGDSFESAQTDGVDTVATSPSSDASAPVAGLQEPVASASLEGQGAKTEAAKKPEETPEERRRNWREKAQKEYDEAKHTYQTGSFSEVTEMRFFELKRQASLFRFFGDQVFMLFVLGAWFVFSGALRDPARLPLFRKLVWIGLPIGAAMSAGESIAAGLGDAMPDYLWPLVGSLHGAGVILMALGYFSIFMLLVRSPVWAGRLRFLSDVGRMALTHYITQSAILSVLFAGYGFGLHGNLQRGWQVCIALALFIAQVLFSRYWLQRHRLGPLEWLWRAITYWRRPA